MFEDLGDLIYLSIFRTLPAQDLLNVSCVSKQFREVALQVAHERVATLLSRKPSYCRVLGSYEEPSRYNVLFSPSSRDCTLPKSDASRKYVVKPVTKYGCRPVFETLYLLEQPSGFSRDPNVAELHMGPNGAVQNLSIVGYGPKILVSDVSTATSPLLRWHLKVSGNLAIEFGVVREGQQKGNPAALHRPSTLESNHKPHNPCGPPLGVYSTNTVGSEQVLGVQVNHHSIVEVIARKGRLEMFIEQPYSITDAPRPAGQRILRDQSKMGALASYIPDMMLHAQGFSSEGYIANAQACYASVVYLAYKALTVMRKQLGSTANANGGKAGGADDKSDVVYDALHAKGQAGQVNNSNNKNHHQHQHVPAWEASPFQLIHKRQIGSVVINNLLAPLQEAEKAGVCVEELAVMAVKGYANIRQSVIALDERNNDLDLYQGGLSWMAHHGMLHVDEADVDGMSMSSALSSMCDQETVTDSDDNMVAHVQYQHTQHVQPAGMQLVKITPGGVQYTYDLVRSTMSKQRGKQLVGSCLEADLNAVGVQVGGHPFGLNSTKAVQSTACAGGALFQGMQQKWTNVVATWRDLDSVQSPLDVLTCPSPQAKRHYLRSPRAARQGLSPTHVASYREQITNGRRKSLHSRGRDLLRLFRRQNTNTQMSPQPAFEPPQEQLANHDNMGNHVSARGVAGEAVRTPGESSARVRQRVPEFWPSMMSADDQFTSTKRPRSNCSSPVSPRGAWAASEFLESEICASPQSGQCSGSRSPSRRVGSPLGVNGSRGQAKGGVSKVSRNGGVGSLLGGRGGHVASPSPSPSPTKTIRKGFGFLQLDSPTADGSRLGMGVGQQQQQYTQQQLWEQRQQQQQQQQQRQDWSQMTMEQRRQGRNLLERFQQKHIAQLVQIELQQQQKKQLQNGTAGGESSVIYLQKQQQQHQVGDSSHHECSKKQPSGNGCSNVEDCFDSYLEALSDLEQKQQHTDGGTSTVDIGVCTSTARSIGCQTEQCLSQGVLGSYTSYMGWRDAELQGRTNKSITCALNLDRPACHAMELIAYEQDSPSSKGDQTRDNNNDKGPRAVEHVVMMFPDDVDVRLACTMWARCQLSVMHNVDSGQGGDVDNDTWDDGTSRSRGSGGLANRRRRTTSETVEL